MTSAPRVLFAGADVRADPTNTDSDWTAERRKQFLLLPEIPRPLSVDPNVWGARVGPDGGTLSHPLPWVRAEDVHRELADLPPDERRRWVVVALGVVVCDAAEEEALATQGIHTELAVQAGWVFVGYDIADGSISGLCNCGYEGGEAEALRRAWASKLNEHGLFLDLVDALEFRAITDRRVAEHAPFGVYGIWVVPP